MRVVGCLVIKYIYSFSFLFHNSEDHCWLFSRGRPVNSPCIVLLHFLCWFILTGLVPLILSLFVFPLFLSSLISMKREAKVAVRESKLNSLFKVAIIHFTDLQSNSNQEHCQIVSKWCPLCTITLLHRSPRILIFSFTPTSVLSILCIYHLKKIILHNRNYSKRLNIHHNNIFTIPCSSNILSQQNFITYTKYFNLLSPT